MSSWRDEVEECMNTVVPETWVTLDAGLFGQDIVILTLEVAYNFLKAVHVG